MVIRAYGTIYFVVDNCGVIPQLIVITDSATKVFAAEQSNFTIEQTSTSQSVFAWCHTIRIIMATQRDVETCFHYYFRRNLYSG